MTAEIYKLSEYRSTDNTDHIDCEIDLETAVDAAIRDLREILMHWGSDGARQRAQECEEMLRHAYSGNVICGPNQ